MDVFGYLIELKQNKVYTHKQYKYINRIVLYTNNGKCYRIAVFAEPKYFHKAKKVGITGMVKVLEADKNITSKLTDITKGKFIIQYYVKTGVLSIFDGEKSVQEQLTDLLPKSARWKLSLCQSEEPQQVSSNESSKEHLP
ncbi:hypothetical protein TVAGG3_0703030 [Trichomonas vaginalis G3]|uniref:hypothetical protein n=1 Tax=Trichomonas vaginalis (strain ATCC PRA-98 / G3) TaxID=412133 RepID=UPI0021E5A71B|nr:hypothetical protein TVAGG3_0703030 [Trichomonas vaginalis G3]KAI5509366.1 hypothetical protein TVAGG3_0703030 [Trichomonas vaginalis G3]